MLSGVRVGLRTGGAIVLMLVVSLAAVALALWFISEPHRTAARHRRLRSLPFPAAWRRTLVHRVPLYRRLPPGLQRELRELVQVFVAEKSFVGCAGLVVSDEMRVVIAAQACLLLLNRRTGCYPGLHRVLVYPGAFFVERLQPGAAGVLQERRDLLSGESWSQGQVILSWADVLDGASVPDDGRNVVIHEFAHQLDQQTGVANGAPRLGSRERYERWSKVLAAAYVAAQPGSDDAAPPLISGYGTSSPAEFFAVTTEVFFEQPQRLAAEFPDLHRELAAYFRVDPALW
jgi:Mlc titration factor MtfA (ptsG expression regulator)